MASGCTNPVGPVTAQQADTPMVLATLDTDRLSKAIFEETNRVRVLHHCRVLSADPGLDAAADQQAVYTALALKAGHYNPYPNAHNVAERVALQNVAVVKVGENAIMMPANRADGSERTTYGYREFAALLVEGWMNSPDHRYNMLSDQFTMLGCAARLSHAFREGDFRIFAVQVFARPPSEGDHGPTRSKFSPNPS